MKARKMVTKLSNGKESTLNVVEHIILKNFWEFYITDEDTGSDDIKFALVMGHETELGDVSLSEIAPFVISRTKNLTDVMPANGYRWVE